MSRERLALAYDNLAQAYAAVAAELRAPDPSVARADVPSGVPAAPAAGAVEVPTSAAPLHDLGPVSTRTPPPTESAYMKCPAHDREWLKGRYGDYCPSPSDDPDWSNDKGYCKVTPRSAAAWVRKHPRGAAA